MATLAKVKKNTVKATENVMERVGLYVRVSTKLQAEEGFSIAAQLKELEGYCQLHGYSDVTQYVDSGITGTKTDREAFQRMLNDARSGKLTKIVATKLDRIARNVQDFLNTVSELEEHNVSVVLLKNSFDTSTAQGKFTLTMFAALAELEASMITERVIEGKKQKASEGGYNGSANVYGYDYSNGVFTPNENASTVKYIFAQFLKGKSLNSIATELNANGIQSPKGKGKWYHVSVRYILNNGIYAGIAQYAGEFVEDKHTAIITVEQHKQAIERLQNLEKGNPNFGKKVD